MNSIYTIPASASFLDILAQGLMKRYGHDPLLLSRVTVLLPNRRSCRVLKERLLAHADTHAVTLPILRSIGDTEDEDILLSATHGWKYYRHIPASIRMTHRQLLLAEKIREWKQQQHSYITVEQSLRLAAELSVFMDDVQREQLSFDALAEIVPDELASHWQMTLDFFHVLTEQWPKQLEQLGLIDPIERRNRLTAAQAELWTQYPPEYPVIAAGTTGSIPATAELLKVIAHLPQGEVILPGLDNHMDHVSWQSLEPSHPQYTMKQWLDRVGVSHDTVSVWNTSAVSSREQLWREVMRPAAHTAQWRNLALEADTIAGLSYIKAKTIQEEATIIALLLREQLEYEGKTAAFVTPHRLLAQRVALLMQRWGITIDDSAGQALSSLPQLVFMELLAEVATSGCAPIPLMSLLKHPFACAGMERGTFLSNVRMLEQYILRGVRIADDFTGLYQAIEENEKLDETDTTSLITWLQALERIIMPLSEAIHSSKHSLSDIFTMHITAAEALASTPNIPGASRLWEGDKGSQVAAALHDITQALRLHTHAMTGVDIHSYAETFSTLLSGRRFRPRYGSHPRLAILSPMEARLHHYDRMILGGLNEGTWSGQYVSPWMSRPMREAFGLVSADRNIGLAAHDFVGSASAAEVILTRSEKEGGSPTIPSSWVMRLHTVLSAAELTLPDAQQWKDWAACLHHPERVTPLSPPAPTPPVAMRPTRLSVTQIEKLIRDPYSIYASKILKLKKLDALDEEPGAAIFGTLVHNAVEQFLQHYKGESPDQAYRLLLEAGDGCFNVLSSRPAIKQLWWPRFASIAGWLAEQEYKRYPDVTTRWVETRGSYRVNDHFTLTATADRIERHNDGKLTIIDYKTGRVPSTKEVLDGISPQLVLEALIAESGGFENASSTPVKTLEYWALKPTSSQQLIQIISTKEGELTAAAKEGLEALIQLFMCDETPYLSCPNPAIAPAYNDYAHLARMKEWSAAS